MFLSMLCIWWFNLNNGCRSSHDITLLPISIICTCCTILWDGSVESEPVMKWKSGTKTGPPIYQGPQIRAVGFRGGLLSKLDATEGERSEGELLFNKAMLFWGLIHSLSEPKHDFLTGQRLWRRRNQTVSAEWLRFKSWDTLRDPGQKEVQCTRLQQTVTGVDSNYALIAFLTFLCDL